MKTIFTYTIILILTVLNSTCFGQHKLATTLPFELGIPNKDSGLKREGFTIWGSSVIKDEEGKYHMFSACWPNKNKMLSWTTGSTILHAISDTPEGPFTYLAEALPPRGEGFWDGSSIFNPVIQKHKDTYILFYVGTHFTNTDDVCKNDFQALANKRIGIATSKSLYGPWERFDKPILTPRSDKWDAIITSNVAPYVEEDGSVILVYKSWTIHAKKYYAKKNRKPEDINQLLGVAHADHYLGPYKRFSEERIFTNAPIPFNSEDPFLWKQNGKYHLLAKIFQQGEKIIGEAHAGYYATSEDGIHWKMDTTGKAYSRTINWTDGTSNTFKRVERPQLLIQDGIPTHIYFAILSFDKDVESRSICVPLKH